MSQLKFKKSFYEATPHLLGTDIQVLNKKAAESIKDKVLLQVDADTFIAFKTTPQWEAFCDYLAKTGQLDPIMLDEHGNVMEGFMTWFALLQRKVAPKNILTQVIKHLKTDDDKITWIRSRKLARANLTEPQRMALVKAEIKAHPEHGNNLQAQNLGVDHKTVGKYRQELEVLGPKHGGIKWHDMLLGANGRRDKNPGKKPGSGRRVAAQKRSAQEKAAERREAKEGEVIQKFLKEKEGLLLTPENPDKTLKNILKVVSETDLTNPALARDVEAVEEAIHRQQEAGWQPCKVEHREPGAEEAIAEMLWKEFSPISVNGVGIYLSELVHVVKTGEIDCDAKGEKELMKATKTVIDNAQKLLKCLSGETKPRKTATKGKQMPPNHSEGTPKKEKAKDASEPHLWVQHGEFTWNQPTCHGTLTITELAGSKWRLYLVPDGEAAEQLLGTYKSLEEAQKAGDEYADSQDNVKIAAK